MQPELIAGFKGTPETQEDVLSHRSCQECREAKKVIYFQASNFGLKNHHASLIINSIKKWRASDRETSTRHELKDGAFRT